MMVLLMSIALLGGGNSAAHQQQVKNSSRADDDTTAGTAAPPPPSCGRGCQRFVFDDAVESHGARCLDGSPPGFYVRPGQGADKAKFLVYSHGGSWCVRSRCRGEVFSHTPNVFEIRVANYCAGATTL
jgi:acetyl esterase/lipase